MLNSIRGKILRAAIFAGAGALAIGTAAPARAQHGYSFSSGVDFTSHFISYGADVWGGGDDANPFSSDSTIFGYATLSLAIADNVSGFINVWGDINDNTEQSLGGNIQEIDVTLGLSFSFEKFSIGVSHGCWNYASDTEGVIDVVLGYNDADMITQGFALNPSVVIHWRYNEHELQADDGVAVVPGIKPTYTILTDSKYPVTLSAPINVAFFSSDEFQGGDDSGYAYFSVGLGASIPLSFVPEKYGAWSLSGSVTYYNTEDEVIPGNPEDSFFVTALSVGMSI